MQLDPKNGRAFSPLQCSTNVTMLKCLVPGQARVATPASPASSASSAPFSAWLHLHQNCYFLLPSLIPLTEQGHLEKQGKLCHGRTDRRTDTDESCKVFQCIKRKVVCTYYSVLLSTLLLVYKRSVGKTEFLFLGFLLSFLPSPGEQKCISRTGGPKRD